jgi:hypothetical protein
MPFITEYLECKKIERHKDNLGMYMNCPVPTKVRIKWVEDLSWEEEEIITSNWRMVRPTYCCVQPDMLEV